LAGMIAAIPQSAEYLDYANAHWHELIERYEPCVMWNDIGYPRRPICPRCSSTTSNACRMVS